MKPSEEKAVGSSEWMRSHIYSEIQVKNRCERWHEGAQTTSRLIWIWIFLTFVGIGALAFLTGEMLFLLLVIPTLIVINLARNIATLIEINQELFLLLHNANAMEIRQLRLTSAQLKAEHTKRSAKLGNRPSPEP